MPSCNAIRTCPAAAAAAAERKENEEEKMKHSHHAGDVHRLSVRPSFAGGSRVREINAPCYRPAKAVHTSRISHRICMKLTNWSRRTPGLGAAHSLSRANTTLVC